LLIKKAHTGTHIFVFPLLISGPSELGIITSNVATDLLSLMFQRFRDKISVEKSGIPFHVSQFVSFKPDK